MAFMFEEAYSYTHHIGARLLKKEAIPADLKLN